MSAPEILAGKREAERSRKALIETAHELQQRLKPGTIAGNAWEGVKERGTGLAETTVEAVKARPVAVSAGLAAFTLFLARHPIKSAVSRLFHASADEDLVTTTLDTDGPYDLTAPLAKRPTEAAR
ncbi:MAG: DUF3618 domain-containing protein [Alphaproteobacteria bacterium]|nr:DUF3618 domain-containing protein [Alphaproteobacteria bacterium]